MIPVGKERCRWVDEYTYRCVCDGGRQKMRCAGIQTQYYDQFTRRAGTPGDRTYRFPDSDDAPLFPTTPRPGPYCINCGARRTNEAEAGFLCIECATAAQRVALVLRRLGAMLKAAARDSE